MAPAADAPASPAEVGGDATAASEAETAGSTDAPVVVADETADDALTASGLLQDGIADVAAPGEVAGPVGAVAVEDVTEAAEAVEPLSSAPMADQIRSSAESAIETAVPTQAGDAAPVRPVEGGPAAGPRRDLAPDPVFGDAVAAAEHPVRAAPPEPGRIDFADEPLPPEPDFEEEGEPAPFVPSGRPAPAARAEPPRSEPPRAAAAPAAERSDESAAGQEPLSPVAVRRAWSSLLAEGEGVPAGMSFILRSVVPLPHGGGRLRVELPPTSPALERMADTAARRPLEQALGRRLGRGVTLDFVASAAAGTPVSNEGRITAESARRAKLQRLCQGEPLLAAVVRELDLELVE
jgi:hypothetical protein